MKIDIPKVLLHLRAKAVEAKGASAERTLMRSLAWVFGSPRRLGRPAHAAPSRAGDRLACRDRSRRWTAHARPQAGRRRELPLVVEA